MEKKKKKKNPPLLTPYRGEAVLSPDIFPNTEVHTFLRTVVKDMEEEGACLILQVDKWWIPGILTLGWGKPQAEKA